MDPSRKLKLHYNLGLLLVCAGGAVVLLGSRWPGLALMAAGAALYYPASRRRKIALTGAAGRPSVRHFWGAAAAVLIAVALSPVVLPRLDPQQNWRSVLPVALIVAPALLAWYYWRYLRRK